MENGCIILVDKLLKPFNSQQIIKWSFIWREQKSWQFTDTKELKKVFIWSSQIQVHRKRMLILLHKIWLYTSSIFHAGVENTYWVQNANFRYPWKWSSIWWEKKSWKFINAKRRDRYLVKMIIQCLIMTF